MLLLYQGNRQDWGSHDIPFTFHYASTISPETTEWSLKSFPLHSTMLLLYLFLSFSCSSFSFLYIPLCFYYICKHLLPFLLWDAFFTFHYASTISEMIDECAEYEAIFTFHYASTISIKQHLEYCYKYPLHSTMLLLYRIDRILFTRLDRLYIPLCFYYITHK